MKKNIIILLAILFYISLSVSVSAQKKDRYVPENGHWQLVSNINDKKTVTVQFYTNEGVKFYEETLSNTRMNIARKKVRRQLYNALKEAYTAWTNNTLVNGNNLIAKRN